MGRRCGFQLRYRFCCRTGHLASSSDRGSHAERCRLQCGPDVSFLLRVMSSSLWRTLCMWPWTSRACCRLKLCCLVYPRTSGIPWSTHRGHELGSYKASIWRQIFIWSRTSISWLPNFLTSQGRVCSRSIETRGTIRSTKTLALGKGSSADQRLDFTSLEVPVRTSCSASCSAAMSKRSCAGEVITGLRHASRFYVFIDVARHIARGGKLWMNEDTGCVKDIVPLGKPGQAS